MMWGNENGFQGTEAFTVIQLKVMTTHKSRLCCGAPYAADDMEGRNCSYMARLLKMSDTTGHAKKAANQMSLDQAAGMIACSLVATTHKHTLPSQNPTLAQHVSVHNFMTAMRVCRHSSEIITMPLKTLERSKENPCSL